MRFTVVSIMTLPFPPAWPIPAWRPPQAHHTRRTPAWGTQPSECAQTGYRPSRAYRRPLRHAPAPRGYAVRGIGLVRQKSSSFTRTPAYLAPIVRATTIYTLKYDCFYPLVTPRNRSEGSRRRPSFRLIRYSSASQERVERAPQCPRCVWRSYARLFARND